MANTRRNLLGASALLAFGTRALPASATAGIPASDADLIRWIDEALEAEARACALTSHVLGTLPAPVKAAVEAEYRTMDDRMERVINRPAVSDAGLTAKARVLRHFGNATNSDGALGEAADTHDRLAWSLTGDLLGCGMVPSQGQASSSSPRGPKAPESMQVAHPDAELLDACAALVAADTERRRVWAEEDGTDAGSARVEAAAEPLGEEIAARAREIAGLPATTWEGQAAKARAASLIAPRRSNGAIISDGMTDDLVWSLVADLAGRA